MFDWLKGWFGGQSATSSALSETLPANIAVGATLLYDEAGLVEVWDGKQLLWRRRERLG